MSFGNAAIFPFPAVQYIPMTVTNICQGDLNAALPTQLIVGTEIIKWRTLLWQDYGITLPESFSGDSLPVLALNLKVDSVKYRGFFVTMIGRNTPGYYQLFTLPRRYFYKNKLYFEFFDGLSGERLASYSLFMPN